LRKQKGAGFLWRCGFAAGLYACSAESGSYRYPACRQAGIPNACLPLAGGWRVLF